MGHPDKVLRILSIIESENDHWDMVRHLENLGHPIHVERVISSEQFVAELERSPWTVILFMSNTTGFSAREALGLSKRINPDIPFILISNGIGEEEVANMMKAGAEDVVLIKRSHRLLQVVRRVLRENEIREKEKNASRMAHQAHAAREQMLAIVSHDIKNPLSVIQLEAQMLLKISERHGKTLLSEEVKIQAKRILKTADRLKGLIVDLLDKNKTEDGLSSLNKAVCDVSKLFQEVIDSNRPLIKQKDIQVRSSFPREVSVEIDKNKLFQVLSNLLSNAIKFTPVGGNICLSIEESDNDFIFSIEDNGPGLKPTDIDRVFEKYWSGGISGCSGTGLGLFICHTIVKAHGGHIRVENLPQRGAKFWFTIPKPFDVKNPVYWIKDNKRKILIIDDDDDLRDVISWALGREGFAVHSYSDPREALKGLKSGRHSPQLMVVDYHMEGMQGSEFLRHKQDIDLIEIRDCPVVMISASPDEVAAENSAHLYKEILSKPIDLEALILNIKKYTQ